MMATKAIHQTGDISRDTPNVCIVYSEDEGNYEGNWITGYGFIGVKFPKNSTKDLTSDEVEKWHGQPIGMGDSVYFLNLKDEDFRKEIQLTKENDSVVFNGTLISPVKTGGVLYVINRDTGKFYQTSAIQEIKGNIIKTRNSTYIIRYL